MLTEKLQNLSQMLLVKLLRCTGHQNVVIVDENEI